MAAGRPIITTNVPGCRDVLDADENGFICEARDAKSLAEAMERMMLLPPSQLAEMGANSRQKVESVYDEKFVHTSYADAIRLTLK